MVIVASLFLASCASSNWHTDNRQVRGEAVAIAQAEGITIESTTEFAPDPVVDAYAGTALDSLMQATFSRYVDGMSRGGLINARYTDDAGGADILMVVEDVRISRTYSIDFVLRGPVIRVRMTVAAYRGTERIFDTRVSASQNMAYMARDGRRFYWMGQEERANPKYQKAALLSASSSALGEAYRRFFGQ